MWSLAQTLNNYDPATLAVEPAESRDLLKKLYQHLFPKSVRHDLGEYYTPDWLAEHVLNELGYEGDPDTRLLDPACGSGTFVVMAINRIKQWFEAHRHECGFSERDLIAKIQHNVIGFDLNPLAVMAARTNYLLACRDLLKFAPGLDIPVYLCDSVMTPAEHGELFAEKGARKLRTAAGEFIIPGEIATQRRHVGTYADTLEFCIRNGYEADDFLARCTEEGLPVEEDALHRELYEQLLTLDAEDQNGIWARIIKNAFAPLFVGRVDFVAGNPPWVNWEHLPPEYRAAMTPLWQRYGLFSLSGSEGRLGGGKKDLAMLFTYSAVDNYLRAGARLGFVITQTVFKTKGAGDGFRRLEFGQGEEKQVLKPIVVHDMSSFQPFEGATNRTAVFVCKAAKRTAKYPARYVIWHKTGQVGQDMPLEEVLSATSRSVLQAAPIDPNVVTSPWLCAPSAALSAMQNVIGESDFRAYAGCCTWLNGVYWVRVIDVRPDGNLLIENLHTIGRNHVDSLQATVEADLVYPLLRGRDVAQWTATPSLCAVVPQDSEKRVGIAYSEMKRHYSKTFAFLKNFEAPLRRRSGFKKYFRETDPFYSIYDVSTHTFAPYKTVWRDMGLTIQAAVVHQFNGKTVVPEHHVMMVPFEQALPAHYLAGALNSSPVKLLVASYTLTTGISAHVLEHAAVPGFVPDDETHSELARLSQDCHAAAEGDEERVAELEGEIDRAAAKLWGITGEELGAIQEALGELEGE